MTIAKRSLKTTVAKVSTKFSEIFRSYIHRNILKTH